MKSISAQLLDSLNNAGLLIKKQGEAVRVINQIEYEQLILAQNGTKAVDKLKETLRKHRSITDFFLESVKKTLELKDMDVEKLSDSQKVELFNEISEN